jgi:biotin operon repressor
MSVKAMAWAWEQDLKTGPKFVLVALADHADGAGVCWPGHELIAEKTGLSRQTVVDHLALLEAQGFVRSERTRKGSRIGAIRYFLELARLSKQPASSSSSMSENPTLMNVGFSPPSMSGFPPANKEEPRSIEPSPHPPKGGLFAIGREELARWFDEVFWPLYPKKIAKDQALAELVRLAPSAEQLEAIVKGLEHRARAQQATRPGEFFPQWPDAHRWIRKRRWTDRFNQAPAPRSASSDRCRRCGRPATLFTGSSGYCPEHYPERDARLARAGA